MDARALPASYTEWAAPAALRDAVACLWAQVTTQDAERAGLVLPDGCTDLVWEQGRTPAVTWAARLLRDPQARAEDVAAEVGLSLRLLRRRCHAAVGYGPKTLQRVLRFRRFVSRIDACPYSQKSPEVLDLAAIAAEAGYAD
ncbi:MAG: hypothetical protein ACRDOH_35205 [Streptosporangiaceae bacterium]